MFRTPSLGDDSYDFLPDKPCGFPYSDLSADYFIADSKGHDSAFLPTIASSDISDLLDFTPACAPNIASLSHKSVRGEENYPSNQLQDHNQNFSRTNIKQTPVLQSVSKFCLTNSQHSLLTRMMSTPRDSILDTLESIAPKFPPQDMDLPDISVSNGLQTPVSMATGHGAGPMYVKAGASSPSHSMALKDSSPYSSAAITVSPSNSSVSNVSNMTPPAESSEDSDDSVPLAQLVKRQAEDMAPMAMGKIKVTGIKKPRIVKKKKKKDPNEPQKPVSAYALFFRDTQAAIKGQNPNATFGEVSKIVASMWEGLDPDHKNAYKKKTETAKKEYLKQLAAYRASLVSQTRMDESPSPPRHSPLGSSPQHMMGYMNNMSPAHMSPMHAQSPQHMSSPHHLPSPHHMSSPHHIPSPQHMTSPHHVSSPQHIPGQQHMLGSQMGGNMNMSSPQHISSQHHVTSPQHMMYEGQAQSPPQFHNTYNGTQSMGMMDNGVRLNCQQGHPTGVGGYWGNSGRLVPAGMCIRTGCNNRAIDNIGWDSEYCSNECVVSHCRDVFSLWVSNRQMAPNSFPVK